MDNNSIQSDELLHKGSIIEVHNVSVRMPSGAVVERDLVHHPGAAVVLPILADGAVVMIRNFRFVAGDYLWWLGLILVVAGLFAIFEAVTRWCLVRACGLKTKV